MIIQQQDTIVSASGPTGNDLSLLTDSLQPDSLTLLQDTLTGIRGIPIPYSPKADDGVAAILLFCFFISAYVLMRNKRFLFLQVKEFFLRRERVSIFSSSTSADMRSLLLLLLQTCVLAGVCFFNYFDTVQPSLVIENPPWILLAIYIIACIIYLLFKWIMYTFLGWVFFDKNVTGGWLESYSTLIYYLGFALFPFALLLIYFDLNIDLMIYIGFGLLIFNKILIFYKWIKLFLFNIYGLLLLILYFCALEIIPCLVFYQGLIQINNLLLLKI